MVDGAVRPARDRRALPAHAEQAGVPELMRLQGIEDMRPSPRRARRLRRSAAPRRRRHGVPAHHARLRAHAAKRALYESAVRDVPYPVQIVWGERDPALKIGVHGEQARRAAGLAEIHRLPASTSSRRTRPRRWPASSAASRMPDPTPADAFADAALVNQLVLSAHEALGEGVVIGDGAACCTSTTRPAGSTAARASTARAESLFQFLAPGEQARIQALVSELLDSGEPVPRASRPLISPADGTCRSRSRPPRWAGRGLRTMTLIRDIGERIRHRPSSSVSRSTTPSPACPTAAC